MQKKYFSFLFFLLISQSIFGQIDSLFNNLNEIVVTATRTERKLGNIAVPVSIITEKNIKQAASLRLNDILNEQVGLFLTSGFGVGVQMQGLNPDYTLILLNGEPLIGRNAGVLDLNRITVGNIQKIEIVKGPSSSLYGSEAMAGVINIITKQPKENKVETNIRYGTYNTSDATLNISQKIGNLSLQYFVNNYSTNGFSIRPHSVERTVSPIWRFTNQLQLNYPLHNKTKLTVLARYNFENINNKIAVTNTGNTTYSDGFEQHKDFNLNTVLTHQFNKNISSNVRLYHAQFNSIQDLKAASTKNYFDYFLQNFYRVENQTEFILSSKNIINIGAGYLFENVRSSRYDDINNTKKNTVGYLFVQDEFKPSEKLNIFAGFRFDNNQNYASAFSPKLAINYNPNKKISINASVGRGFKAPDFRQLYLNFTNTAAGSYSVFGALEAQAQVLKLDQLGQIQSYESDFYNLSFLKPEFSTGINIGTKINLTTTSYLNINLFRNDVENLIDNRLIANYKNGSQIFSYLNVKNAFTKGIEINYGIKVAKYYTISSGYQFLLTGDKQQIESIKNGLIFTKDINGIARKMELSEYYGLPNRSRNMANLKLLFESKYFFINTRIIYRDKWAVADKDGNGVYNTNDEFANGFVQINFSIGNQFKNGFGIQTGCDNITNYSDINNLPNMLGRNFYLSINYQITKNKKQNETNN